MEPTSKESRRAFEAWCRTEAISTRKDDKGRYFFGDAAEAWKAWKAAVKFMDNREDDDNEYEEVPLGDGL